MSDKRWTFFHKQLQDYLSVLIMSLPPQSAQIHSNQGIQQATVLLSWMHEENIRRMEEVEKARNKINKPNKAVFAKADFYNEVVNENMSMRVDFINWKKQSGYVLGASSRTDCDQVHFL